MCSPRLPLLCILAFNLCHAAAGVEDIVKSKATEQISSTILRLASYPVSLLYSIKTTQYPNYQEEVFSGNPNALERLKKKTEAVDVRTEYVKAILDNSRYSIHRIVTHGEDVEITLNNRLINDGITICSLLYSSDGSISDLSKRPTILKLEESGPMNSRLGQIAPPQLPWKAIEEKILGATGCSNLNELAERISNSSASEQMLKFEHGSTVSTMRFAPSGLPVEIITLSNNKPIKTTTTIAYSSISMPDGTKVDFPTTISSVKQIKIDGEYKTYISFVRDFKNVKYLTVDQASKMFSTLEPTLMDESDISSMR